MKGEACVGKAIVARYVAGSENYFATANWYSVSQFWETTKRDPRILESATILELKEIRDG